MNPKQIKAITGNCPSCNTYVDNKGTCPNPKCRAVFRADGTFFESKNKKGAAIHDNTNAAQAAEKPQKAAEIPPVEPQKAAEPDAKSAAGAAKDSDGGAEESRSFGEKVGSFLRDIWNS